MEVSAPSAQGDGFAQDAGRPQEPLAGNTVYRKLRDLNEGAFGFVQLAKHLPTGDDVAIKFLERGQGVNKSVLREILNHRLCVVHPNIIQFREVFLTPKFLAIVMEYAAGGDMFEYVIRQKSHASAGASGAAAPRAGDGLPEDEARWFFQQLVVALDFCHELGIANRDIKLENTLLDGSFPRPKLKICDFGYSKNEYVDSRPKSVSGTPDYIAPEVLLHEQYDGKRADIWSCGVLLYVMLTGVLPFAKRGDERTNNLIRLQQMFPRIVNAEFEQPPHITQECRHLLSRTLTADPSRRVTIFEIMQHPWFTRDLPPELADMNRHLLTTYVPANLQSVEQIEEIVNEATQAQEWNGQMY